MPHVTIYTTAVCPYCHAAKRLLTSLDIPFEEIGLDGRPEERARLSAENGGWRTVPMVFIGERFIGGFRELSELHRSGGLTAMLRAVQGAATA
jgi:glutaredoxin 3